MPQDYTQTVRSFYDAFARRDTEAFTALLDPQIEWSSAENFLYADHSPYVGVEAVATLILGRVLADWDAFTMNPAEILAGGEIVIASGRIQGMFKANRAPIDAQFVQVFQFKDGRIAKVQMYTDTAQFKETIGRTRSVAT
jgi:ketosteroid isomerase-like protein